MAAPHSPQNLAPVTTGFPHFGHDRVAVVAAGCVAGWLDGSLVSAPSKNPDFFLRELVVFCDAGVEPGSTSSRGTNEDLGVDVAVVVDGAVAYRWLSVVLVSASLLEYLGACGASLLRYRSSWR